MHPSLLRDLQQRRFSIRARWEAVLRAEPVTSPLAHPDALVHLIDSTLEEIFTTLDCPALASRAVASPTDHHHCPCGRNPLLAYFAAGRQAVLEGLILAQSASGPLSAMHRDASLDELMEVMREIASRDIEAFCGLCQFRHLALTAPEPTLALCGA